MEGTSKESEATSSSTFEESSSDETPNIEYTVEPDSNKAFAEQSTATQSDDINPEHSPTEAIGDESKQLESLRHSEIWDESKHLRSSLHCESFPQLESFPDVLSDTVGDPEDVAKDVADPPAMSDIARPFVRTGPKQRQFGFMISAVSRQGVMKALAGWDGVFTLRKIYLCFEVLYFFSWYTFHTTSVLSTWIRRSFKPSVKFAGTGGLHTKGRLQLHELHNELVFDCVLTYCAIKLGLSCRVIS